MLNVLEKRSAIYDQFHQSSAGSDYFYLHGNEDTFAAYYTSMYLIQDTGESVLSHLKRGFSADPMDAYLEFWGVMQAIAIQQDSIFELYYAVLGSKPKIENESSWNRIRDIRHRCAGHPAKRMQNVPGAQRTFMGRSFGTYDCIQYELWDASVKTTTYPTFNLRQIINGYDKDAANLLDTILSYMKFKWP